jgi:FeS assembly SUF system regulator
MIKLNKMTDYAVVCLGMLSRKPGYPMSATELSKETGITLYTVQKLLKVIMSKSDLIRAHRGALGGYILNRNSSEISVVEIIEALEGPITLTSCVDNSENLCESSDICFLGGKWNKVNNIIRKTLNNISLNDLLNFDNPFVSEGKKEVVVNTIN